MILALAATARVLHDFSNVLSGLSSGLELAGGDLDPDLKAEGIALAESSAKTMGDLLEFFRLAYAANPQPCDGARLQALARAVFPNPRVRLHWEGGAGTAPGSVARITLLFGQIAAMGMRAGGDVTFAMAASGTSAFEVSVRGQGVKAELPREVADGLDGRPCSDGVLGRWAPGAITRAVVLAEQGDLSWGGAPDAFEIRARLPSIT